MNTIHKLTLALLSTGVALGVTSCKLDVVDPTNLSSETFWQSESDVHNNLTFLYANTVPGVGIYDDAYTDDVRCPYPWESPGSTFQTNGLSAETDMGYDFTVIRAANLFIQNVSNVKIEEALKERVLAEARLLRAWNYAELTKKFGKVPLVTKVLEYDMKELPRDDADKVRAFVLDEFAAVAEVLPEKYSGGFLNETSRITKYGAYALRARYALIFGNYKEAEASAREVMKGNFALYQVSALPEGTAGEVTQIKQLVDFDAMGLSEEDFIKGVFSYRNLWDNGNVTTSSPECVIVKEYKSGDADYADLSRYTSMRPDQMVLGWSSVVPQQPLLDAYWSANGQPFTAPTPAKRASAYKAFHQAINKEMKDTQKSYTAVANDWVESGKYLTLDYLKEFKNRDARLYASVLFPMKKVSDTDAGKDFIYEWRKKDEKVVNNESTTGFNFIKMVAKSSNTLLWGAYPCSEVNFPVFRYAEALLIFAEAHTVNSGYDAEVVSALNQLRNRVGMPNVPTGLGKKEALDLIRNERRIELAGEGHRLSDIRRYGADYQAKYANNVDIIQPDGEKVLTLKWDKRMVLFPIPQTAMDVNPSLRQDQNPGY